MKAQYTRTIIAGLLLINLATAGSFGHTVRSRELCGTIASIDASNGTVEVKSERSSEIVGLAVRDRTVILKDWKRVETAVVEGGRRACVFYRSPIFGKPFISKIILLNEGDECPLRGGGMFDRVCKRAVN